MKYISNIPHMYSGLASSFFFFLVICVCRFINYCIEKEGYTGYNIYNLEGTEEVVERLIALNIHEEITGKRWP